MLSRWIKFFGSSQYEDLEGENRQEVRELNGEARRTVPPVCRFKDSGSTVVCQETYSMEQAIDQIGFGSFQIKLSFLTGFAWMADAMEMMILAILSPAVHCVWQLKGLEEAAITVVVFCGMTCSSGIWGSICDNYGRRTELVMCSLVTCYFGVLSAFSPNLIWLMILRGLVGFGIGGAPQAVTLYAEFLPAKSRAVCVTLVEMFWAVGACFEVILALLVMPTLGWRWLLALSSVPLMIFSISCVWLPESARFDLAQGRYDRAVQTLKHIAQENGQPMPHGKLVNPPTENVKYGRFKDLLQPALRTTTLLLWTIWFISAFCYYGIVLLTTALFENPDGCHGTDVLLKRAPACFLECQSLTKEDLKDIIWTTLAEFPGLFLAAFLMEKIGRKYTMAMQFGGFVGFVLLVNICSTRALLTVFLFAARTFISGAFQGVYIYTPEFYPTSLRAMGLGVCSGMARVGATLTPFFAQVLLKWSSSLTISVYGLTCLVAVLSALLLPFETRGREMKVQKAELTGVLLLIVISTLEKNGARYRKIMYGNNTALKKV